MNKIIHTSTRLFMAVVELSGSGKTDLNFKLLKVETFIQSFQESYTFYKDIQPVTIGNLNSQRLQIKFFNLTGIDC